MHGYTQERVHAAPRSTLNFKTPPTVHRWSVKPAAILVTCFTFRTQLLLRVHLQPFLLLSAEIGQITLIFY
jgi:hypothetical protein